MIRKLVLLVLVVKGKEESCVVAYEVRALYNYLLADGGWLLEVLCQRTYLNFDVWVFGKTRCWISEKENKTFIAQFSRLPPSFCFDPFFAVRPTSKLLLSR